LLLTLPGAIESESSFEQVLRYTGLECLKYANSCAPPIQLRQNLTG
jgi:hypothetical protein